MKPYIFSKKDYQEALKMVSQPQEALNVYYCNWKQAGYNICYNEEWIDNKKCYYILSFDYEFKNESDEMYLAACPPYSYTFLNKNIETLCANTYKNYKVTSD
jgi:hypothetical protein